MCLSVPGRLLKITGEDLERQGVARFGHVDVQVSLAFTPEANVDDFILVHSGCAIRVLDRDEAARVIQLLETAKVIGAPGQ